MRHNIELYGGPHDGLARTITNNPEVVRVPIQPRTELTTTEHTNPAVITMSAHEYRRTGHHTRNGARLYAYTGDS